MQKYAPHFADGALPLQVGVGLTRMAATPRRRRLFCSGTLCGRGYGGWFCPITGQRSGLYVHPVGVAPVLTRSGPHVTIPGYPGLSKIYDRRLDQIAGFRFDITTFPAHAACFLASSGCAREQTDFAHTRTQKYLESEHAFPPLPVLGARASRTSRTVPQTAFLQTILFGE